MVIKIRKMTQPSCFLLEGIVTIIINDNRVVRGRAG